MSEAPMKATHYLVTAVRNATNCGEIYPFYAPGWLRSSIRFRNPPGTTRTHLYRAKFYAEQASANIERAYRGEWDVTITPMVLVEVPA